MTSQKSRINPTESRTTLELKKNKTNASKQDAQSYVKTKPKKVKKISKSIKRIESEMSEIQKQMAGIVKDLTTVLDLMRTNK